MDTLIFEGNVMAEQALATCSADLAKTAKKHGPTPIPVLTTAEGDYLYFPATGLRGGLRRAACRVAQNVMGNGAPAPLDLQTYYMLTIGGITGPDKGTDYQPDAVASARAKNPLVSLFGANNFCGLGFVAGRLSMGNAIARQNTVDLPPMQFSGARADDFRRTPEATEGLNDKGRDELSDARKAFAERNDKEKEKAEGTVMSPGRPLAGWLAIPPRSELAHTMVMARVSQVELGLFLKALNEWAQHPFIGAHYAAGCGMFSAKWAVSRATEAGTTPIGTVTVTPFEGVTIEGASGHGWLTDAITAFDEAQAAGELDFTWEAGQ